MKSKIQLTFLLLILTTLSYPQANRIGLNSGMRISNVFNNLETTKTYGQPGWSGGITYEREFANKVNFSSDLVLYKAGFLLRQDFIDELGDLRPNQEIPFKYNYVGIPLRIGYSKGEKVTLTGKAGLCPAMILSAKYITPGGVVNGQQQAIYHSSFQSGIKKFDISIMAEVRVGVNLGNRARLIASLVEMVSLTNHTTEQFYKGYRSTLFGNPTDKQMKHYGIGLNFGIDFKLGPV